MIDGYEYGLISIYDISVLEPSNIIIGLPEPIKTVGTNYRIRRAEVIMKTDNKLYLIDLDNFIKFEWDLYVDATNQDYKIFLLE